MSSQTHKNNEKLKALLAQKKKQDQPGDDFEKEAIEGFAMLQNDAEALDMKAELDVRMEQALTSKTTPSRTYWLAAAGLALVVGLSAYLILANDPAGKQAEELAVTSTMIVTDSTATTPVAESGYEQKAAEFKSPEPQKAMAKNEKTEPAAVKAQPVTPIQAPDKSITSQQQTATLSEAEPEIAAGSSAPPLKATKDESSNSAETMDKMAYTDSKADAEREELSEIVEKKKSENQTRAKEKTARYSEPKVVANSTAIQSAPAGSALVADSIGGCYYAGGEAALDKELTAQLVKQNLDKHFNATLIIDSNGKVMRVKFTKTGSMSAQEQNQITVVLRAMDKFKLRRKLGDTEWCEYRISR